VVTLGDIGDVRRTFKEPATVTRYNGQRAFAIDVTKRPGANIPCTPASRRFSTLSPAMPTKSSSFRHADYKAANLLLREEAGQLAIAAVLDWEFACAGAQIFDMGILLRHDRELDPAFAREFARGFTESGGTLHDGWRRMARLADFVNLVTFLDAPEERSALFADVTRLLIQTLDRWEEE
jgi:Ser/Thr protein kinase RdoA (MazF antagonist)